MRSLEASESQIQCAFIELVRRHEGRHVLLRTLYAVPNGQLRDMAVAGKLSREGVRRGVFDIILPVASEPYIGLALEFKRSKHIPLSIDQRTWQSYMMMARWRCERVWDAEMAWDIVKDYVKI